MTIWPCQVPLRSVPEVKFRRVPTLCCPEGLVKKTRHSSTPEMSSVNCAVTFTLADAVVVFTAFGANVKLVSVGGVMSEARAGRTKRQRQANTLAAFLTELLPAIDICTSYCRIVKSDPISLKNAG